MKTVKCKQCSIETIKNNRDGSVFCNMDCYTAWKRIHPNKRAYKGRVFISGYWYLYMPSHPNAIKRGRYVAEHRLNLEKKIGRYLSCNEVSHHKNGIKTDNRLSNLELLTKSEHIKHHANERSRNKKGRFKKAPKIPRLGRREND